MWKNLAYTALVATTSALFFSHFTLISREKKLLYEECLRNLKEKKPSKEKES